MVNITSMERVSEGEEDCFDVRILSPFLLKREVKTRPRSAHRTLSLLTAANEKE